MFASLVLVASVTGGHVGLEVAGPAIGVTPRPQVLQRAGVRGGLLVRLQDPDHHDLLAVPAQAALLAEGVLTPAPGDPAVYTPGHQSVQ
jgi:hypothetical protein